MINYDKDKIKEELTIENYFELLTEFNGNPTYMGDAIVSDTICHNEPGDGSHKLYFYFNEGKGLFHCYTGGCEESSFDVFQLVQKIARIQWKEDYDLNDSVRFIARRFGIAGFEDGEEVETSDDWKIFANYGRIKEVLQKDSEDSEIILKEYDDNIFNLINNNVVIKPWIDEGITEEVLKKANIGYYAGENQISIPHLDKDGRLIGVRGRTLSLEDAELYGKYRPIRACGALYNHPLGFNLYGFNWSKENIKKINKAVIYESEKSVLLYASYFGWENNISVACCGSNISSYQINQLIKAGAKEIIIAFDRQFQSIGDKEWIKLTKHLTRIKNTYGNYVTISFIFDKNMITSYKASPIDEGKEKFLKLFKERIII